uniref:Uncharacterized protein n=1 Tax=viral metagenome TaxID=1070528 RepID=A0A6C0DQ94_9ZZZZ
MLKIAYCLYGQPRNLEDGYNIISKFVENYNVDFYYHTWTLNHENEVYSHSNYRNIKIEEIKYDHDIINKINLLYKPKKYISELSKYFDYKNFENSLIFNNLECKDTNRISNTFSNFYSKQKVRDLLNETLEKEKINYDLVIISRFDMLKEINIDLNLLDKNKIYVSNIHNPRYIFSDAILIMNVDNFLNLMNAYNNLENLMSNNSLNDLINSYNEKLVFAPENILFANYLYYFKNFKDIEYIDLPNFV